MRLRYVVVSKRDLISLSVMNEPIKTSVDVELDSIYVRSSKMVHSAVGHFEPKQHDAPI